VFNFKTDCHYLTIFLHFSFNFYTFTVYYIAYTKKKPKVESNTSLIHIWRTGPEALRDGTVLYSCYKPTDVIHS
jgi:hypothetical protein